MNPSTVAGVEAELRQSRLELGQLLGLGSRGLLNASPPGGLDMDGPYRGLVLEINRYLFLEMAELSIEARQSDVSVVHTRDGGGRDRFEFKWTVQLDAALFGVRIEFCLWYGANNAAIWSSDVAYRCTDLQMKDASVRAPSDFRERTERRVPIEIIMNREPNEGDRMRNMFELLASVFSHLQPVLEISRAYDRWKLEVHFISLLAIPTSVDMASYIVRNPTLEDELPDVKDKIERIIARYRRLAFTYGRTW
jgi:hypothetical protein